MDSKKEQEIRARRIELLEENLKRLPWSPAKGRIAGKLRCEEVLFEMNKSDPDLARLQVLIEIYSEVKRSVFNLYDVKLPEKYDMDIQDGFNRLGLAWNVKNYDNPPEFER